MRLKLERCPFLLMLAAGTMPLVAVIDCKSPADGLLVWPMLFVLAAVVCLFLPGRARLPAAILLAAGFVALGAWWFLRQMILSVLLVPLLYIVLLFCVLPMAGWERGRDPSVAWALVCLALHAGVQVFFAIEKKMQRGDAYAAAELPVYVCFLLFLLLALQLMNRSSLQSAVHGAASVPLAIRLRNRVMLWCVLGFSVLVSFLPALGRLLARAASAIRSAVRALILFLASLRRPAEAPIESTGGMRMDFPDIGPAEDPSAVALWLERILMAVAAVALCVCALWELRFLWKQLRRFAHFLARRLQRYVSAASEDYVDETQTTRQQGTERFLLSALRIRPRVSARELKKLPPRERVRRRYALAHSRHPEWHASQTARETLPDTSAQIYEKARYSSREITEEEAEGFLK